MTCYVAGIHSDVCVVRYGLHTVCHQNARAILPKKVNSTPFSFLFYIGQIVSLVLECVEFVPFTTYFILSTHLFLYFLSLLTAFWPLKCLPRILCGTCVCSAQCTCGSTFWFSTRRCWRATAVMRTNTALLPLAMSCVTPLPTAPARLSNFCITCVFLGGRGSIKVCGYKSVLDFVPVMCAVSVLWWIVFVSPYFTTCLGIFYPTELWLKSLFYVETTNCSFVPWTSIPIKRFWYSGHQFNDESFFPNGPAVSPQCAQVHCQSNWTQGWWEVTQKRWRNRRTLPS